MTISRLPRHLRDVLKDKKLYVLEDNKLLRRRSFKVQKMFAGVEPICFTKTFNY